jgi:hypothetical protein
MVVVSARPGLPIRVRDLKREPDEIDGVLDDVFGESDDSGPGAADVVLLIGGLLAMAVGWFASLSTKVTVGGAVIAGLGAVLLIRSLWRKVGSARRDRHLRSLLGDGCC